ncbi:hypothetical protein I317_06957 [Kwoniella heveanensis CBS 569]|nr:hypothetical protein I317_06957 [Kwoniella heveanensis CBS 569]
MVFNLPSLSSGLFASLIDTSPPVFYPASASTSTPTKGRTGAQSTTASPQRPRKLLPLASPSGDKQQLQQLPPDSLPASASGHDFGGEWEPLASGGIGERRCSIGAPPLGTAQLTPTRPTHRRAHSALPTSGRLSFSPRSASNQAGPTGKLTEISRNSLASTSAVSLPTLAEGVVDVSLPSARAGGSMPPSPLVRPCTQTSAGTNSISPSFNVSDDCFEDLADVPDLQAPKTVYNRQRAHSSVPPPQNQVLDSNMPPPPLRPMNITYSPSKARTPSRPPVSPRSWSSQDIHTATGSPYKGMHSRRASIESNSSVSVSDVAVLATWSFPNKGAHRRMKEGYDGDREERGRKFGPSDLLKERLRNIPGVETGPFPSSSSVPSLNTARPNAPARRSNTIVRPSRPLPSHLTSRHRHTHSSPNLLQIPGATIGSSMGPPAVPVSTSNPLLPPPKPVTRRPTTSRLRQPNPLIMPTDATAHHHHHGSIGGGRELGSSPGSIGSISDTSTLCPSPTTSVKSLPAANLSDDSENEKSQKAWWGIPGIKRGVSLSRVTEKKQVLIEITREGRRSSISDTSSQITINDAGGWDSEDEEEYIDLDDM